MGPTVSFLGLGKRMFSLAGLSMSACRCLRVGGWVGERVTQCVWSQANQARLVITQMPRSRGWGSCKWQGRTSPDQQPALAYTRVPVDAALQQQLQLWVLPGRGGGMADKAC
jgi:hypothetical protein